MKRIAFCLGILVLMYGSLLAQPISGISPRQALIATFKSSFQAAAVQYQTLAKVLPKDKFPKTYYPNIDKHEYSGSGWWCSGFYPASLFYLYQETKRPFLLTEAKRMLELLEKEQFNTHTNDLGFMMFCSFGNALAIEKSNKYKNILINSAKSLASRFNPTVGCIKSWDGKPNEFLVIIDNMMNLDLLFWATKETGDSSFYKIAVTHANTTLKNHFRPDNSSYHVINYNVQDGSIIQKKTAQGAGDESAWSRGQVWGLYGYTATYRETREIRYLQKAMDIAEFILNHPNLPADHIPYWDFNAPGIPDALRDASAGAIMASALIELAHYADLPLAKKYIGAAETILQTLASKEYSASEGTNGGFLLKHSVGSKPGNSEVDAQ